MKDISLQKLYELLHEVKQPLNVIRLSSGNIRSRISRDGQAALLDHIKERLDRIEQQTERAAEIVDHALSALDNKPRH